MAIRKRRGRALRKPTIESAARSLWKDLADERRRGLVQTLGVVDGELVLTYAEDPVEPLPSEWEGYRVRQQVYRRPEGEIEKRLKATALGFLGIAERDPERVMRLAEGAVDASRNLAEFAKSNSGELRKFLLNNVITGVAKGVKKRLERG